MPPPSGYTTDIRLPDLSKLWLAVIPVLSVVDIGSPFISKNVTPMF